MKSCPQSALAGWARCTVPATQSSHRPSLAVADAHLTGKIAFSGETVTDTLAAVVMKDPDWSQLPPKTRRKSNRKARRPGRFPAPRERRTLSSRPTAIGWDFSLTES